MKIVYITRPIGSGFSIERVFQPIVDFVSKIEHYETEISHSIQKKSIFKTMIFNALKYRKISKTRNTICHITCEVRYCGIFMNKNTTILTTHDTFSLCNPNSPWYARLYCYWIQFYFPMKHLKYLTCISEATKNELIKYFPWVEPKLRVITNSVESSFTFEPYEFNANCPCILHIGTAENKNLTRVAEALEGINCHLRIIGKLTSEQVRVLEKIKINYSNSYNLSDEEIIQEYRNCDIVSFPSLFEGFGMPIIEAQTIGRPVLTSNREPMKSVAGDASILVYPENVEDIRQGYMKLLNEASLREQCITKGLENVKKYKVENIAKQYVNLYSEIESNLSKR